MGTRARHGLLVILIFASYSLAFSQAQTPVALTGVVTSDAEGRMEGVLVTAKPDDGNIRITVISDDQGRYAFPAGRLQQGKYSLAIRAVGYELPGPIAVDVPTGKPAHADIKLIKTKDLSAQLTGAEWLMSVPGDEKQKKALRHCNACHSISVPAHSSYDEEGFLSLLPKMQNFFVGQSTYDHPFPPPPTRIVKDLPIDPEMAKYLSSINLSDGKTTWPYELRTFPRPRGGDTKVIITEYVLSRRLSMPHDVSIDQEGQIWYSDFRNGMLGRLDPVSGKQKEWTLPILRPGQVTTVLYVDVDKHGNPWMLRLYQGCAVTMMDAKTETFRTFTVPAEYNPPNSQCSQGSLGPDGMKIGRAHV
jgi:virginiamycin B lyase